MLCIWVQMGGGVTNSCDPGRGVSDGYNSGWRYTKLSLSSALLLYFYVMCFVLLALSFCRFWFVFVFKLSLELFFVLLL